MARSTTASCAPPRAGPGAPPTRCRRCAAAPITPTAWSTAGARPPPRSPSCATLRRGRLRPRPPGRDPVRPAARVLLPLLRPQRARLQRGADQPDYRPDEIAYLMDHSEASLALAIESRQAELLPGHPRRPFRRGCLRGPRRAAARGAHGGGAGARTAPPRRRSSTPPAPPAGPRAASSPTSTSTPSAAGTCRAATCPALRDGVERMYNPAAAPRELPLDLGPGDAAVRRLPGVPRPLPRQHLVAGPGGLRDHRGPHAGHHPEHPAEAAALRRGAGARGAVRALRRDRAQPPRAVRAPLRLAGGRDVGDVRDRPLPHRQPRAAPDRHRAFGRAVPGLEARIVDERDEEVPPGSRASSWSGTAPRRRARASSRAT